MSRPTYVLINTKALRHNLQHIRNLAPDSKIMAIIKANAYGHGLVRVAKLLHSVDAFGVCSLEEAVQLREAHITNPIVLLQGHHAADCLARIVTLDLDLVIHSHYQIDLLEQLTDSATISAWIKFDTGMHRLGFPIADFAHVIQRLQSCKAIGTIRLMSHFAVSAPNHPLNIQQLENFSKLSFSHIEKTIANSTGILFYPQSHHDWVRPGLMLYGVSPVSDRCAHDYDLQPVMRLESKLIAIQYLHKDDPVGYGASFRCPKDMPIGIVSVGYADGFPRHARSGTPVLINGMRCGLVGKPSMDMLAVDLSSQPTAKIGDRVILWGDPNLPIEEVAAYADTIAYELLSHVHRRLPVIEFEHEDELEI